MGSEVSTIQSLKAVDAWIDVINSNINGGVRTSFKSSRLKFGGTNVDVERTGTSTNLPLQIPETGLATANTVIDFSQGAVTASTENTHLAIQGTGWFVVVDPGTVVTGLSVGAFTASTKVYLTRDGEFHANQNGYLVNSNGYFLVTAGSLAASTFNSANMRLVYDDLDNSAATTSGTSAIKLSDFINNTSLSTATSMSGASIAMGSGVSAIAKVTMGQQALQYTQFGSTVFSMSTTFSTATTIVASNQIQVQTASTSDATILSKSLEASNASMTQSVPELSLAQKLFSALTKVLQITQTNTDSVLNLIR